MLIKNSICSNIKEQIQLENHLRQEIINCAGKFVESFDSFMKHICDIMTTNNLQNLDIKIIFPQGIDLYHYIGIYDNTGNLKDKIKL